MCLTRDLESTFRRVNSCNVIPQPRKPAGDETITASEITDGLNAVKCLNCIYYRFTQPLTGAAVRRTRRRPLKLGM